MCVRTYIRMSLRSTVCVCVCVFRFIFLFLPCSPLRGWVKGVQAGWRCMGSIKSQRANTANTHTHTKVLAYVLYAYAHPHPHTHTRACRHIGTYTERTTHTQTYIQYVRTYVHTYVHTYAHTHKRTYVDKRTCVYVCTVYKSVLTYVRT